MMYLGCDLMNRHRNYLVVMTEALVACDLAQAIEEFDPSAKVISVSSVEDAEAALADLATVEIAFVARGPTRFAGTALHRSLVVRGGRVVLLGLDAEDHGPSPVFDVLSQPFDTDAVVEKLKAGIAAGR